MNIAMTRFEECTPTPWTGRYGRIMGDASVFHLRNVDGRLWPVLAWDTDAGIVTCPAYDTFAARGLANAVARAKRHAGGYGGGSFLINEYGKVLVPASEGDGRRFLAGQINTPLLFENPLSPGAPIDLADDDGRTSGDCWNLSYVGVPYHLHRNGGVYFYQVDENGGRSLYPAKQDASLIQAIRKLRPYGPVRILVTLGGLVLTKMPSDTYPQSEDRWTPVFVGKVDFNLWFEED